MSTNAIQARLRGGRLRRIFLDRAARGELPGGHDASVTVAAIVGPLFYRRWFSKAGTAVNRWAAG